MSEPQADAGVARGALLPWLLGALALVLRLQGITFGLDFDDVQGAVLNNNIDERGMVEAVQENLLHGNLDPGSFVFRGPAGFLLFGAADLALVSVLGWRHEGGFAAARQALEANHASCS